MCESKNWHPNAEQKILSDYTQAAKNLDYKRLLEISNEFPKNRLEQNHMISFSYAATQLKQHQDAIDWAQQAVNHRINDFAVNRCIAALVFASQFTQAIDCFKRYQHQVTLDDLDNFALGNLLTASSRTHNWEFAKIIMEDNDDCDSTDQGAGLLYFNAACVASVQNNCSYGFRFLVAARLNNFSLDSINADPDLVTLRNLPEFSVLQTMDSLDQDFYRCYESAKELWYFRDHLYEIDFMRGTCSELMFNEGSPIAKALTLFSAIYKYEQQGNKLCKKMSAAVAPMCTKIISAIQQMLESENGKNYIGIRFEWDFGEGPLARYWWAAGVPPDEEFDEESAITFETYCWCTEEMYQQLVEQLKAATKPLFMNRQFYIQLGEHDCGEGEAIKLGN